MTAIPKKNLSESLSDRDQLSFIFLQFQRTLILISIRLYEWIDEKIFKRQALKLDAQVLDLKDDTQVKLYLNYCRLLQTRYLIKASVFIHNCFDQSRKLKLFSIYTLLLFRRVFRFFFRSEEVGPYKKWTKLIDSPSEAEVSQWKINYKIQNQITLVLNDEALGAEKDVDFNLNKNASYFKNVTLWTSNKQIANLNFSHFLKSKDLFQKNLPDLLDTCHDWIIFQTEPGQISERAFHEISLAIEDTPKFVVAYGDTDLLLKNDRRVQPHFHPNWNLRYFIGEDCLRGLLVFSKQNLKNWLQNKDINSWPELIATLAVDLNENQIHHIPKILFHSRVSSALDHNVVLNEIDRQLQTKFGAHIEFSNLQPARISWPLPPVLPKISILIPTRDREDLLKNLIQGLLNKTDYDNVEIVIVDNQSSDKATLAYFDILKKNPKIKIYPYPHPFNYSAINNFGFKYCTGEILALLNNDLEVIDSQWLKEMLRECLAPDVGIVGAKLYFKNNYIQHAGVVLGSGLSPHHVNGFEPRSADGYLNRLKFPHQLSAVTGACMLMQAKTFAEVHGFNAKDLSVAYNDIDLCLRVSQRGLKIVWTPLAELYHLESASRPPDRRPEQIARYRQEVEYMRKTWISLTQQDPYYNPNFSRTQGNFKVSIKD